MKLINIDKKTFLEFFMVLTSLTLIFLYLYLRITRKQPVIALIPEEIQAHYGMFLYFFIMSCVLLGLLLLTWLLTLLLKRLKTEKDMGVMAKFFLSLRGKFAKINIFYKSYVIVFKRNSPKYTHYLVTYANNIVNYGKRKNIIIISLAVVLPRVLILCTFLVELYMKTLHYYFFSLLLLLIPLFFRFLLFVYSDIHKQILPELNEVIERVPNTPPITLKTPQGLKTFGTITFRFKRLEDDDPNVDYDLDHFMFNYYNPMLFIGPHMEVFIMPLYYKINSIIFWIYAITHVIGWGYVLFYLV